MERRVPNNFQNNRGGFNRPNFQPNPQPSGFLNNFNPNNSNVSNPSAQNKKVWYIAGAMLLVILLLVGFWIFTISNSDKDVPNNGGNGGGDEEEPLITTGGCDHIEITIDSDSQRSCFNNESGKIKLYITRSQKNIYFYRLNFIVYSSNDSINLSSDYGLTSSYTYELDYNDSDIEKIEVYAVVKDDGKEKECSAVSISSIVNCSGSSEPPAVESHEGYTLNNNLEIVPVVSVANSSINSTNNISIGTSSISFSGKPQKKILGFNILLDNQVFVGKIDNIRHMVSVVLPENSSLISLRPIINISENATIHPPSGSIRNFEQPVTYIVTDSDGNTQEYTVYVNKDIVVNDEDYPEEDPKEDPKEDPIENPVKNLFSINLFSIENSTSTTRQIKFFVLSSSNISNCTLYLNGNVQGWPTNIINNSNNTFNLNALSVNNHSVRIGCVNLNNITNYSNTVSFRVFQVNVPVTVNGACGSANRSYFIVNESFGSDKLCNSGNVSVAPSFPSRNNRSSWMCLGSNGGVNASCSASRFAVSQVSGLTAGVWSVDISSAKEMARLNKNYFIINYGDLETCSLCRKAESAVFTKEEFKAWARENGVALIYINRMDKDKGKEVAVMLFNTYIVPRLGRKGVDFPYIVITGYDNKFLAGFTYRSGSIINRIKAVLTPKGFIEVVNSYTSGYR